MRERDKFSVWALRLCDYWKEDKELIWKAIYSGVKVTSGKVPTRKTRKILHHSIYILPLNVGDKGAAKI